MTDAGYSVYGYQCQSSDFLKSLDNNDPRYNHSSVYHNGQQYLQTNNSFVDQNHQYFQASWYDYYSVYHQNGHHLRPNNSFLSQGQYCQTPWYDYPSVYHLNGHQYLQPDNSLLIQQQYYQAPWNDYASVYHPNGQQYQGPSNIILESVPKENEQHLIANDRVDNFVVDVHRDTRINEHDLNLITTDGQVDEPHVDVVSVPLYEHETDNQHDLNLSSNDRVINYGENVHDVRVNEQDSNVTDGKVDEPEVEVINIPISGREDVLTESVNIKRKHNRGCDKSVMYLEFSDESSKQLCCPYCDKLYVKLAKHMETKHKEEQDVKRFLSFPKGSKQRREIQDSLRKIGMDNWNMNPLKQKRKLITSRRPNRKYVTRNTGDYISCPYCRGQHSKSALRLHVKYTCPKKPRIMNEKAIGHRKTLALATLVEARHHENVTAALANVFKNLRDCEVVRAIKFDWLIVVYGNKLCQKYTRAKRIDMIQNRLRLVGRILLELKRIQPEVKEFSTLYRSKYYDNVIEAIQVVARLDSTCNEYGAPGTASSAVTAIKKIGILLRAEYIKMDDQEKQRVTENFLTLMDSDIHDTINRTVNETQNKRKRQKKVNLPSMEDIKLLAQYIEAESETCMKALSTSFDYKNWLRLSHLTLGAIIVFNRKRVGDAEDILIEEFNQREVVDERTNELLFLSLSEESKETVKQYSRLIVRGKKDFKVPVLLKPSMEKQIDLLLSHRDKTGILPNNEFVFALPPLESEIKVIKACTVLNKFARVCGAKNPSSLTATLLRKQLATFCVSLELNDTEVADVADFMGHAEKVHRQYYRQNTIDRQIVKMSKVLEAAQGNATYQAPKSSTLPVSETVQETSTIKSVKRKRLLETAQKNVTPDPSDRVSKNRRSVSAIRENKAKSSTLQESEGSQGTSAIKSRSTTVKKRKRVFQTAQFSVTPDPSDKITKNRRSISAIRGNKATSSTLQESEVAQGFSAIKSRSTTVKKRKRVLQTAQNNVTPDPSDKIPKNRRSLRVVRKTNAKSSALTVLETVHKKSPIKCRSTTDRKRKAPQFT